MKPVNDGIIIRPAAPGDAPTFAGIYNHFIATSIVTFEENPISAEEMARRMAELQSVGLPWLTAEVDGTVAGYAYAGPWKTRSAYRHSVEVAAYLAPEWVGRGLGTRLYVALEPLLKDRGIHAVIGGAALPNGPSVALMEKMGFQKVAHFREVGQKFGKWIDVGYWERILE